MAKLGYTKGFSAYDTYILSLEGARAPPKTEQIFPLHFRCKLSAQAFALPHRFSKGHGLTRECIATKKGT